MTSFAAGQAKSTMVCPSGVADEIGSRAQARATPATFPNPHSISIRMAPYSTGCASATRICAMRPGRCARISLDYVRERVESALVALRPQAADHAGCRQADIGMVTKALAAENIGQMHLDDRQFGGEKRVEHRHRGVSQCPGVENDAVGGFA